MFTGIITALGLLNQIKKKAGKTLIKISLGKELSLVKVGSSLAVSGVCLTVIRKDKKSFWIEAMPETLRRTNFKKLRIGDKLNIEWPLKNNSELGGHFVQGHIDGVGKIVKIIKNKKEVLFTISTPKNLIKYFAEKSSVALEGASLTIFKVRGNRFTVALTSYTLSHTNLDEKKVGDEINLEVDILAKYLEKLVATHSFRDKRK